MGASFRSSRRVGRRVGANEGRNAKEGWDSVGMLRSTELSSNSARLDVLLNFCWTISRKLAFVSPLS